MNISLTPSQRTVEAIGPVKVGLRGTWNILKQMFPNTPWYTRLYRWYQLKTHKLVPNKRELSVEELYTGLLKGTYGYPYPHIAPEYDRLGKIIKSPTNEPDQPTTSD